MLVCLEQSNIPNSDYQYYRSNSAKLKARTVNAYPIVVTGGYELDTVERVVDL